MSILITDATVAAAVSAAVAGANGTREAGVANALAAAFGAGNVTLRVYSDADTLLCTFVYGPVVADTTSAQKSVSLGAFTSYSFAAAGTPAYVVWASTTADILESSAGVGSGDISFLTVVEANVPVSGGSISLLVVDTLDTEIPGTTPVGKYRTARLYLFDDVLPDTELIYTSGYSETPARATTPGTKSAFDWRSYGPTATRVCSSGVSPGTEWNWNNTGGDWVNQNGVAQATTLPHFTFAANAVTSGSAVYSVDVLAGVDAAWDQSRWNAYIVRCTGGSRSIASHHHSTLTIPSIAVTYADDTTATLACVACTRLDSSTAYSYIGQEVQVINSSVALEFERPAKAVTAATMTIALATHTGTAAVVSGYLADPPRVTGSVTYGVANGYVYDESLRSDASILFSHTYLDGTSLTDYVLSSLGEVPVHTTSAWSPDLFGLGGADSTKLPTAYNGVPLAGKWIIKSGGSKFDQCVTLVNSGYTGDGFEPLAPGVGALRLLTPKATGADGAVYPATGSLGCDLWALFPKDVSGLLDETYVRFYVRMASSAKRLADTKMYAQTGEPAAYQLKQGKWGPGVHHWTYEGGNNGVGGGNLGWTNRLAYHEPPADLTVGGCHVGVHSYDMLPSGSNMMWGKGGGRGAALYPDEWYCVEVRCKLNTWNPAGGSPSDGIMQVWIDGVLVSTHTGWSYRDGPLDYVTATVPADGLPPFRNMGPIGLLMNHYQGGVTPCDEDFVMFITMVAAGTQYIGPVGTSIARPAWWNSLAANTWLEFANGDHGVAVAAAGYANPGGSTPLGMMAYSGGCVDPNTGDYYSPAGGGHGDYAGNEVLKFHTSAEVPTWEVVGPMIGGSPRPTASVTQLVAYYADGRPTSRHTYRSVQWDETNQRLLLCGLRAPWHAGGSDVATEPTDAFDLGALDYLPEGALPQVPQGADGNRSVLFTHRDPSTGKIWAWNYYLLMFDPVTETWTDYGGKGSSNLSIWGTSAFDHTRQQILQLNANASWPNRVLSVAGNPAANTPSVVTLTGAAAGAVTAAIQACETETRHHCTLWYAGWADKFVLQSKLTTFWSIDPVTWECTQLAFSGSGPTQASDVYNRFIAVDHLQGFLVHTIGSGSASKTFFIKVT